jgi:hypothetical protein
MLRLTVRLSSLACVSLALACHHTEPPKAEGPTPVSAADAPVPTATATASASTAPPAAAAASTSNRWTTPVDCAARDAAREKSALTPEDRQRDRFNCELSEELRAFVAARQACQSAADCGNVTGSCPFGCAIPVAQRAATEVTQKLATLVERQEKQGTRCAYRCAAPETPACIDGRCTGN